MKVVELRRHTIRASDRSSAELSPEGIKLAERVRATLEEPYELYVTSPKARARETLRVLGGKEPVEEARLGTLPFESLRAFEEELRALQSEGMGMLGAYFAIDGCRQVLLEKAREVLEAVSEIASRLSEGGRALGVSHGGTLEPAALLALGADFELSSLGGDFSYCEGVKFYLVGERMERVDIIRLPWLRSSRR